MSDYSKGYEPIDNIQCSLGAIEGELDAIRNSINLLIEQYENRKEQMNKDSVSREAVVSLAKDIVIGDYRHRCIDPQSVLELPPVTPKPKTGKIIMGGYDCDHYICSECGHDFGWFSKPDYKYCPYCGTKLEGE